VVPSITPKQPSEYAGTRYNIFQNHPEQPVLLPLNQSRPPPQRLLRHLLETHQQATKEDRLYLGRSFPRGKYDKRQFRNELVRPWIRKPNTEKYFRNKRPYLSNKTRLVQRILPFQYLYGFCPPSSRTKEP